MSPMRYPAQLPDMAPPAEAGDGPPGGGRRHRWRAALIAVVIACSAMTYYLVEKPMQRLGHRLAKRWDPPQLPPGGATPGNPPRLGGSRSPQTPSARAGYV